MRLPPIVASFLTICFMAYLFRRDIRQRPNVTSAIWIPTIWLFITGTRFLSQWLLLFGLHVGGVSVEEGSPVDAALFFGLIAAGAYVLGRRRIPLGQIIFGNLALSLFLLYGLVAVVWSDYGFVAFKHWIKDLGLPIMALVILSEPDPDEALARVMKRCTYIIAPVSILFIKYYPQWGRGFSSWTGQGFNTGITLGKNALGYDCMIFALYFFWYTLKVWKTPKSRERRNELILCGVLLSMIWWLFDGANSKTPLVSTLAGMAVMSLAMLRKTLFNFRTLIQATVVVTIIFFAIGGYNGVLGLLGRDASLTDRTYVWDAVKHNIEDPLFGAGYESFWIGKRVDKIEATLGWRCNEAHNGYLETYINLGMIGLAILILVFVASFFKIMRSFSRDPKFASFRLGFLVADLLYNWTESSFMAMHPVWFVFYFVALDFPTSSEQLETVDEPIKTEDVLAASPETA